MEHTLILPSTTDAPSPFFFFLFFYSFAVFIFHFSFPSGADTIGHVNTGRIKIRIIKKKRSKTKKTGTNKQRT
ncbi:hypothetical protein TRSC58_07591 [Trypanosoma rangeli SC58]|uniref:Uncharacterized protein n=1 Tax=Trypanosoma rangeli SC58 TaxID=429131 RepID=A0A061IRT7_TRYRA|nr:hypothetical protein TRSC58_07591 [Trypanosoma rangeli SC58]